MIQNSWNKKTDYMDIPEGSAPGNPAGDTARLYCKDVDGVTRLFFRDSAGNEREISYSVGTTMEYICLRDVKSQGTNGGSSQTGAWYTRTLNEKTVDETGDVTLSSDRFTLPAGTYVIETVCPFQGVNACKIKLYNYSDSSDTLIGGNIFSGTGESMSIFNILKGQFTISAEKTFEIQYRCQNAYTDTGLGIPTNFSGYGEIYTVVELWKIA